MTDNVRTEWKHPYKRRDKTMKKLFAILMTLCMLCAACSTLVDREIPTWDNMPKVVIEDENTTVDEAAFEGEWVLDKAFLATDYID